MKKIKDIHPAILGLVIFILVMTILTLFLKMINPEIPDPDLKFCMKFLGEYVS